MGVKVGSLPMPFIWRRLHSLFGLWIVLFLIEHLLTNSQSALLIGEHGEGFIRAVNFIKNLPYLPVIEVILLGVPILFHMVWGIKYALSSKSNAKRSNGSRPALKEYGRNRAYSWQRITSWILLIGIIWHVGYMRFYCYPAAAHQGNQTSYFVKISMDPGLYSLAPRLGVKLYNAEAIQKAEKGITVQQETKLYKEKEILEKEASLHSYDPLLGNAFKDNQTLLEKRAWLKALKERPLTKGSVIAESQDFGTATLLIVRDSFKSVFKGILYTIFVLAAAYHGFNGLWTFMISWGLVLKMRSQKRAVNVCIAVMLGMMFLGLASIWGTYWINLRG